MIDYNGKKHLFSNKPKSSSPLRMFFGMLIILGLGFVMKAITNGQITPLFSPTSTPTRTLDSYSLEGETHFTGGNLDKAIEAYQNAVKVNPKDTTLWAELARIQVYSTTQLTTDSAKRDRLNEAFATIEKGLAVNNDDSMLHAVKALADDWYATSSIAGENWQSYLNDGESEAVQALQLDSTNNLAKAYYAEILVDQQKWTEAEEYINQALEKGEEEMDIYRIAGYVQESLGNYKQAIEYYQKAIAITPNMNLLYMKIGACYRTLAGLSNGLTQTTYYNSALEAFAKAVQINNQQGVKDPTPLVSIANTYVQMGEFYSAGRNMIKAVQYNPTDPTVYGQLGIVYYKSRNYEGAIPALKCYVRGCTAVESCFVRNGGEDCDPNNIPDIPIEGQPLSATSAWYYVTYGNDLAVFGQCDEALVVFDEIEAVFGADPDIMINVNEGRDVCGTFVEPTATSEGTAAATTGGTSTATTEGSTVTPPTATPAY
jgi:tetratricopeptide (TPR) repeat protein